MQPYTGFASVYNIFMDSIPYEEWADFAVSIFKRYHIDSGLVLELGCGTGSMTERLSDCGYDMIGIDQSEEMLSIAREKRTGSCDRNFNSSSNSNTNSADDPDSVDVEDDTGKANNAGDADNVGNVDSTNGASDAGSTDGADGILYLCQDMREFELYGTVAAVCSFCDTMNYMLEEEDLLKVFRLVNNYLDPGGLFLFDMDTPYAFEKVMGDTTLVENRKEGTFIWENNFYPEEMINEVDLTLFLPETGNKVGARQSLPEETSAKAKAMRDGKNVTDGKDRKGEKILYEKYEEIHVRRAYSIARIKELIGKAGMEWIAAYDADTKGEPEYNSERIYILAREKHQDGKEYL